VRLEVKPATNSDADSLVPLVIGRLDVRFCEAGRATGSEVEGIVWVVVTDAGRPKLSKLNKLCALSLLPEPLVGGGGAVVYIGCDGAWPKD
jgi:hypothetical protein